ncbi:hypothetical protein ACFXAS_35270 [Streptomyces sp. NPDC059459]|uniref:hypothetical protein n=1 Tax=Streptomyces sp. NPDC059459 TaxID=3346839 RepID=UPI0036847337
MIVFDIRLGLTVLDATDPADTLAARRIVDDLHRRTTNAQDGYAARETLTHPRFTAFASDRQAQDCHDMVRACALGAGGMPNELHARLASAVRTSDNVIRAGLARPFDFGRLPPVERA